MAFSLDMRASTLMACWRASVKRADVASGVRTDTAASPISTSCSSAINLATASSPARALTSDEDMEMKSVFSVTSSATRLRVEHSNINKAAQQHFALWFIVIA